MSEPFLAEIKLIGFNFAPRGWAFCDGQILPINQNQSLYSLLGSTYGGDGRTSFALPDLRGRTPSHEGNGFQLGQKGGNETVTLTVAEMAAHRHLVTASVSPGDIRTLPGSVLAMANQSIYRNYEASTGTALRSGTVSNAGASQAHENMQPYLTISFVIALQGLFPSRN